MKKTKRSRNDRKAIRPALPSEDDIRTRSELMEAIQKAVYAWDVPQAIAAERLALTLRRMNDLMQGRVRKFSLYTLMNLALGAGLGLQFDLKQPPDQTPIQ